MGGKLNLFGKGRRAAGASRKGAQGSANPAQPTRGTKRVAGGQQVAERPYTFAEEAVVYVWHERNVLKLPGWMGAGSMQTGHAAMKLAVFDPDKATRQQVEYVSWWPGEGADKSDGAAAGQRTKAYVQDRAAEMVHDAAIRAILTMQFMRKANNESEAERALFTEACKAIWEGISASFKKKLTDKGVRPNFANLAELEIQARSNQKAVSSSQLKAQTTTNAFLRKKHTKKAANFSLKLQSDRMEPGQLTALYTECMVVKQPYAKIYLPCSCAPRPAAADERYTPWGLSLSAMRMAFRAYEPGISDYRMQSYEGNCIAAVWTTLEAGLADVFVNFKPTKGVVKNLAHLRSLLPSDAIQASSKLSARLDELRQQQLFLDGLATKYHDLLGGLATRLEWDGEAWREPLENHELWRTFSDAKGARPAKKRKLDSAMAALAKVEKGIQRQRFDATEELLKMEGRWEVRRHDSAALRDMLQDMDPTLLSEEDYSARKSKFDRLSKASAKALTAWEQEVEHYEKPRRDRAAALIKVHQAIADYISSIDIDGFLDERFYSALLLSQFVAWRFIEVCHDNMTLVLERIDGEGLHVAVRETSTQLADIYPHLRYVEKAGRHAEGGVRVIGA